MMNSKLLIAIVLSIVVCVAAHGDHGGHSHSHSHDGDSDDSHVLVLTGDNFDETVAEHPALLVEFYAPWCGHCKKLAPEWEDAAHRLDGKASLAKVDCTDHKDLCGRYDVKGFPTIKLFRNDGNPPSDYNSGRTADAITSFMLKQMSPAWVQVHNEEELKAKLGSEVVAVGFFTGTDSAEAKEFIKLAQQLRNEYTFVLVTGADATKLSAAHGASVPDVVVFKPFDEPAANYDGEFNADALADFVNAEAFPLVGEIGPENYSKYLERELPLVWLFVDKTPGDEVTSKLLAAAKNVATSFKGSLSFVYLDGVRWADHAKNFGLSGATPGIVIEDREDSTKFVLPQSGEVSEERLNTFINGYLDGSLAPTVKSQEIPKENNGPVKVVVGKSFDSIVMDDSKDVFLEFYAPWCGHCKSLAPKWEKLGEMFAKDPSVVIAKVDATENDTPTKVQGFPTLIFYPAGGKKSPITYSGDRTEDALAEFVRKNANSLKGKKSSSSSTTKTNSHEDL